MRILGIDVCSGFCSAALLDDTRLAGIKHEPMQRGQSERLAPLVKELLNDAKLEATALDGIAVTTGPGSFTGARLGVSFARGLSLATGVPAVGLSIFETIAYQYKDSPQVAIALRGKNGSVLLQVFSGLKGIIPPGDVDAGTAWQLLPSTGDVTGIGPEINTILNTAPDHVQKRCSADDRIQITSETVARAGVMRLISKSGQPAPLYLREADAKPQKNHV